MIYLDWIIYLYLNNTMSELPCICCEWPRCLGINIWPHNDFLLSQNCVAMDLYIHDLTHKEPHYFSQTKKRTENWLLKKIKGSKGFFFFFSGINFPSTAHFGGQFLTSYESTVSGNQNVRLSKDCDHEDIKLFTIFI